MPDCLIIGVGFARAERPMIMLRDLLDVVLVARVVKRVGCFEHAEVERGEGPVLAGFVLDARKLPVGYFAHGGFDRRVVQIVGKGLWQAVRGFRGHRPTRARLRREGPGRSR